MGLCHRRKEKYNSRGYRFLMFTGISAGILPLYPRGGGVRPATGISAGNLSMYPRGGVFPPGHGYIRGKSSPVPARWCFSAQPRVYSREILSCTRAVVFFRQTTGISAGNLLLYPHGGVFLPGHGYIRGKSFPVPAQRGFSARPRVYSREIFPCTRAAGFFCPATGIFAGNLSLYPRSGVFLPGHGYIRGKSFPVPARWHKKSRHTGGCDASSGMTAR